MRLLIFIIFLAQTLVLCKSYLPFMLPPEFKASGYSVSKDGGHSSNITLYYNWHQSKVKFEEWVGPGQARNILIVYQNDTVHSDVYFYVKRYCSAFPSNGQYILPSPDFLKYGYDRGLERVQGVLARRWDAFLLKRQPATIWIAEDSKRPIKYSQGNFTFYLKEWDPRHREDLSIPEQCHNNFV